MKIHFNTLARPFLLFCVMNLFNYCHAQQKGRKGWNGGVMMQRCRFAAPATGMINREPQPWDCRIWYCDSMVIQEVKSICTHQATNEHPVLTATTVYYLFSNLRTGEVYRYPTFTDTVKAFYRAIATDSNCTISYRKFPETEDFTGIKPRLFFSDTLIGTVLYCRVKTTNTLLTERGPVEKTVCLYQHGKHNEGFFSPEAWRGVQPGSMLLRFETVYHPSVFATELEEYICLNQTLTRHELRVFAAWKRNARKYGSNKKPGNSPSRR